MAVLCVGHHPTGCISLLVWHLAQTYAKLPVILKSCLYRYLVSMVEKSKLTRVAAKKAIPRTFEFFPIFIVVWLVHLASGKGYLLATHGLSANLDTPVRPAVGGIFPPGRMPKVPTVEGASYLAVASRRIEAIVALERSKGDAVGSLKNDQSRS